MKNNPTAPSGHVGSSDLFGDFVRKHALAVENLTEQQLAEAIRQAIAAGDFQRNVMNEGGTHKQAVIYLPYHEVSRLQSQCAAMQLKADMFDYLCWLEDFCAFRQAALDGKTDDYLVLAADGTTCWGKTYAEAVRVAMEHDKEMHDATSSPNIVHEPHREDGRE